MTQVLFMFSPQKNQGAFQAIVLHQLLSGHHLVLVNKLSSIFDCRQTSFGWLWPCLPAGKFGRRCQPSTKKALRCALRFWCCASLPTLSSLEPKRNSPAGGQDLISLPVLTLPETRESMIGNLISTYKSDYSTGGITIQEKKSAQGLPWRYLVHLSSEHQTTAKQPNSQ